MTSKSLFTDLPGVGRARDFTVRSGGLHTRADGLHYLAAHVAAVVDVAIINWSFAHHPPGVLHLRKEHLPPDMLQ